MKYFTDANQANWLFHSWAINFLFRKRQINSVYGELTGIKWWHSCNKGILSRQGHLNIYFVLLNMPELICCA